MINLFSGIKLTTYLGVTITIESDGAFHLSGTSTAVYPNRSDFHSQFITLPAGEYTLSTPSQLISDDGVSEILCFVTIRDTSGNNIYKTLQNNYRKSTFSVTDNDIVRFSIGVNSGVTLDRSIYVMLESGSVAHDYIPPTNSDKPVEVMEIVD